MGEFRNPGADEDEPREEACKRDAVLQPDRSQCVECRTNKGKKSEETTVRSMKRRTAGSLPAELRQIFLSDMYVKCGNGTRREFDCRNLNPQEAARLYAATYHPKVFDQNDKSAKHASKTFIPSLSNLPGSEPIHWGFDDPVDVEPDGQDSAFRQVRRNCLVAFDYSSPLTRFNESRSETNYSHESHALRLNTSPRWGNT